MLVRNVSEAHLVDDHRPQANKSDRVRVALLHRRASTGIRLNRNPVISGGQVIGEEVERVRAQRAEDKLDLLVSEDAAHRVRVEYRWGFRIFVIVHEAGEVFDDALQLGRQHLIPIAVGDATVSTALISALGSA